MEGRADLRQSYRVDDRLGIDIAPALPLFYEMLANLDLQDEQDYDRGKEDNELQELAEMPG